MSVVENIPKGIAYAVATALVGSTAGAASKFISADVPVPVIVLVQYLICLLLMLPWLCRRTLADFKTARPGAHFVRGITGWLCFFTYYQSLSYIPLVDATLLRSTAPLFVPLVVWLWLKRVVPGRAWLPMIIGFAGVTLILRPDVDGVSQWHLVGLASGLMLAFSMVGTRTLSTTEAPSLILFYYFLISFLCSIPMAVSHWQAIPLWTLPYLAYVGISITLAMWLYTRAYSFARASVVSPINYTSVVFSGFLGWMIWAHTPDGMAIMGMLCVIAAGLLSIFINKAKSVKEQPEKEKLAAAK
ncbi:MAG: DMT family transporter [Endozoicomonas sp.]